MVFHDIDVIDKPFDSPEGLSLRQVVMAGNNRDQGYLILCVNEGVGFWDFRTLAIFPEHKEGQRYWVDHLAGENTTGTINSIKWASVHFDDDEENEAYLIHIDTENGLVSAIIYGRSEDENLNLPILY